jgi:biotin carboxyl carrier protein
MRYYVTLPGDDEVAIDVVQQPGGRTLVHVDGEPMDVDVVQAEGAISVRVGARVFDLWLEHDGKSFGVVGGGVRTRAVVESERTRIGAAASRSGHVSGGRIEAPMPGRVVKLMVEVGDTIEAGAPVIVVEAMKMENELCADAPGIVTEIHVEAGANVESGAALVEIGPLE